MRKSEKTFLKHAIESANRTEEFIKNMQKDDFMRSTQVQVPIFKEKIKKILGKEEADGKNKN